MLEAIRQIKLDDVFKDTLEPFSSFDEFYRKFEEALVACNTHDCKRGKCAKYYNFGPDIKLQKCSKTKPAQRVHQAAVILH